MRVRSLVLAALVTCGVAARVSAQDWATAEGSCFAKGQMQASLTISAYPFGPNLGFDYAFTDAISGGGFFGYGYSILYDWEYYRFPLVIHGAFHPFNLTVLKDKIAIRDKLDAYGGIEVGWAFGKAHYIGPYSYINAPDGGAFVIDGFLGASYYFTPQFYANAETQPGYGWFKVGIGYKF